MPIISIRELCNSGAEYAAVRDQYFGHNVAVEPAHASRTQPRNYRQPATLWARVKVALSFGAARRDRACARLNTLYTKPNDLQGSDAQKVAVNDLSTAALKKFAKAYIDCGDQTQRMDMMASLHDYAKEGAIEALKNRRL